jgi:hypothetical protein
MLSYKAQTVWSLEVELSVLEHQCEKSISRKPKYCSNLKIYSRLEDSKIFCLSFLTVSFNILYCVYFSE